LLINFYIILSLPGQASSGLKLARRQAGKNRQIVESE